MGELRVSLLGGPRFAVGESPVILTRRKVVALLAYLAATGQPQSREVLAALLWPDSDPSSAYAYLRNALWLIRKTPIADFVDVEGDLIGFRPDATVLVDAAIFERSLAACRSHSHPAEEMCAQCLPLLERAVQLYQGDFLSGFTLPDSAAFDEWQLFETEAHRQHAADALRHLVSWYSQSSDAATAIAYALRWHYVDPLHEEAGRCLMALYAQTDQRAAALHVYEALIHSLRAQGLTPQDETVDLYRRIRAGTLPRGSNREAPPPAKPATVAQGPPPSPLPTGTVTFLFTDIESSVALWDRQPAAMKQAVSAHHAMVRETIEAHGGVVFKVIGDAFQAAFPLAPEAVKAPVALQRALSTFDWAAMPALRDRIGLHTGPAEVASTAGLADYEVSHTLNRVARIMTAGHGGQILASQETAALVMQDLPEEVSLRDLGEHQLKGFVAPQHLYQVTALGLPYAFPPLATSIRLRPSLPVPSASFIGREAELAEIHRLLEHPEVRLITLTGPGGIGKTRLALQLAAQADDLFADAISFVALATAGSSDRALTLLVDTLGLVLYEQGTASLLEQLAAYLRDRQTLLILDNFEQVRDGPSLVAAILDRTRLPKILVTSRQRLNLRGEWTLELSGLPWSVGGGPEPVAPTGAARLFIDRARQVRSDFDPDGGEWEAIVRICDLVQGIPLGLELSAAWTKLLSCDEIASEIGRNLDFLSLSMNDVPERHRSLRAVFQHSWRMLSAEERRCYEALSVFRGGFSRSAAEEVAGVTLPILASLIDKSMLRRTSSGRYEILEVLRQYAAEQLAREPDREAAARDRHAASYLEMLQQLEPALKGPGPEAAQSQLAALEAVQEDRSNIRAAWRWAAAQGRFESMWGAALSLALAYELRSRFREGLELFDEALAAFDKRDRQESTKVPAAFLGLLLGIKGEWCQRLSMPEAKAMLQRALMLMTPGGMTPALALVNVLSSYGQNELPKQELRRRLEESLAFYRAHNDDWGTALTLAVLGESFYLGTLEEPSAAKEVTRQALAIRQEIRDLWGVAMSLFTLGSIALAEGAYHDARRYYQESLEVRKQLRDNYGAAQCLRSLGWIAYRLEELDEAERLQQQSLEMLDETGSLHGAEVSLELLAAIAIEKGNLSAARGYLLEACARRKALGDRSIHLADALKRLGEVCDELGEVAESQRYREESRILAEAIAAEAP